jgi:hypothetical protein
MSEVHDNIADIIDDRATATTDPVINLRTGATFHAEIDGNPDPMLVITELGEDAREVTLLHVTSDAEAAGINAQDLVQFRLFGAVTVNRVLKRVDSPAGPQADFWCQKVVDGKDA